MKKNWLILVLIFAVAGLAAAGEVSETFAVSPGGLLDIDLETGGDISITGWDRNEVTVEASTYGKHAEKISVNVEQSGDKVLVTSAHTGYGRSHSGGAHIVVKVPNRFSVELETMGGDIDISGVEGRFSGETMGGDITLSDLRGNLDLQTMGGDIELTDADVDGEVQTMGGDVLLERVAGDVDASSMGGDMIYKNVTRKDGSSTGDAAVIETMGGDIRLNEAFSGAKLNTMGGDITVGAAAEFVEAETMGGDIEIGEIDGWVKAETMGGDVEVTVIGDPQATDRDIELTSMGGDIVLTVPRNFSMSVEIEIALGDGPWRKHRKDYQIQSDFPLQTEEVVGDRGRHGESASLVGRGTFAGGKNQVKIYTAGGNVYLKQGQ